MEIYIVTEDAKYSNGEEVISANVYDMQAALDFAEKTENLQDEPSGIYIRAWDGSKCLANIHKGRLIMKEQEDYIDELEFQALLMGWARQGHFDKCHTSETQEIETSFEHAAYVSENYIRTDSRGEYNWAGFQLCSFP